MIWKSLIVVASLALATEAQAHSDGAQHYPKECCSNVDCAPAEVEVISTQKFVAAGMGFSGNLRMPSQTILKTVHGTAVVPENFDPKGIYDSTDGRNHACIRKSCSAAGCVGKLICWFKAAGQ